MGINEIITVNEISDILYDFLPGNPNPYADKRISFPGCAKNNGLENLWIGGSKKPAISHLITETLETARGKFCPLILDIVKNALSYRSNKGKPINREEIEKLNKKIEKIGFRIPELWDKDFLNSLTTDSREEKKDEEIVINVNCQSINELKKELIDLLKEVPQQRGFKFEKFLNKLFSAYNLEPRKSFRIIGEQIDGSFQLEGNTYLVEAKWRNEKIGKNDLLHFKGEVDGKATWSRGLFISYSGFTEEGLKAFAIGKPTNIIGMDALDLHFILEGKLTLPKAIEFKARRAAETNDFFVSVYELQNCYQK